MHLDHIQLVYYAIVTDGLPGGSVVKNLPAKAGDMGLIPRSGRFPGEGNDYPLQYSCQEKSWLPPDIQGLNFENRCSLEDLNVSRLNRRYKDLHCASSISTLYKGLLSLTLISDGL